MAKPKIGTVRDKIYWSYANLAMVHTAVDKNQEKYTTLNYMIRAKLFKGLKTGSMNIRTIFNDEKIKVNTGEICNYCGSPDNLALDHIFPKKYAGKDDAQNLIYTCKSCNSSKGKKDLMEWMYSKNTFLPLMIIRRYLKLVYSFCEFNNLLSPPITKFDELELPFKIKLLPTSFPKPSSLSLNAEKKVTCSN